MTAPPGLTAAFAPVGEAPSIIRRNTSAEAETQACHEVVTFERGDGFAARCDTPGCEAITFGGFSSPEEAVEALECKPIAESPRQLARHIEEVADRRDRAARIVADRVVAGRDARIPATHYRAARDEHDRLLQDLNAALAAQGAPALVGAITT